MKIVLCMVFIASIFQTEISAQGEFLPRGAHSLGLSGSYSSGNDAIGYNGGFSFSLHGIVDFGITYNKYKYNEKFLGADLSSTAYTPILTVHTFKQNDSIPITMSLTASYQVVTFSNSALDEEYLDMTGSILSFGVLFGKYYEISPFFRIQPSAGISYSITNTVIGSSGGSETYQAVYRLGVPLVFNPVTWSMFVIYPKVEAYRMYPPLYTISLSYFIVTK